MIFHGLRIGGPVLVSRLVEEIADSCFPSASDPNSSSMDPNEVNIGRIVSVDNESQDTPPTSTHTPPDSDSFSSNFHQKRELSTYTVRHYSTKPGDFQSTAESTDSSTFSPSGADSGSTAPAAKKPRPHRPARKRTFDQQLNAQAKENTVPTSRVARLVNYGTLGVGLGIGAVSEIVRRTMTPDAVDKVGDALFSKSAFLTEANAERIVTTLCKVRGAALKLGQALSIQDNSLIHPQIQEIFERVRYSADFMPGWQVRKVLEKELGSEWESNFASFDERPFAAASIGQVHRATLKNGDLIALKIQYPGVDRSIDSDISNVTSLLRYANVLPKGLYAEAAIASARVELADECDYVREAWAMDRFRELLADDPDFKVPKVYKELTTKHILPTEMIYGRSLDKCKDLDQETKDFLAKKMIQICLREVFEFRFMQSDPNWSNFFWDDSSIALLDFGAAREYSKKFVDGYLRIIKAAAEENRSDILKFSREIGFLTGYESKVMEDAHCDAVEVLGTALSSAKPLNFGEQDITRRIERLVGVMLKHRLTPPPQETYSIHRKLSGTFLLCTRLNATVHCRPMFDKVFDAYNFEH